MRFRFFTLFLLGIGLILAVGPVQSQERGKGEFPGGPRGKQAAKSDIKKYDDVITKEYVTQAGVFAVHRLEDKVFFEIPQDKLGRLFLWQAEVAKGPGGQSWGGTSLGSAVLKFERRGHKIYVWRVGFSKRASGGAVLASIEASSTDTIIAAFEVECEGKDRSSVINVSDVLINGYPDLSLTRASGGPAGSVDGSRSYLSEVKNFPTNIESRSIMTFRPGPAAGPGGSPKSVTALVHQSLVLLPETPMTGRLFDSRVGYFTEGFTDFSKGWATERKFITRYRLEKKDPNAEISEPVKPIVFYLSKEIPEKWRPSLKKGVEDWQKAFEKAGFKNAILCKDAPTKAEDPNFDPEDARYSVIRWVAEPVANAMGPHVHDPRSGEIISSHIIFWHDVVKLSQVWYFIQCSALDPKARKFPLPDELTGELLRYITTHEVGHTLGLRHNHRASQAYSIEQLRNPEFAAKNGSVASIMSYGRFNYVAQPEDNVKHLFPIIAPYDFFAIDWGYKNIAGAKSPDDEKKTLDEWAAEQIKNPFLRFGGEDGPAGVDPTVLTENIGSDRVESTALGLKNLDRVLDYLVPATTEKGEEFNVLEEVYSNILAHRSRWFQAVAKEVGGVVENRILAGREGETFVRVPKEKQKAAVKFLLDNAFTTPTKLLNPAIVNQFKYTGAAATISNQQRGLLATLLSSPRIERLHDSEILIGEKAYTVSELVNELQAGLFSELKQDAPKIDPLRRTLQFGYLEILKTEFSQTPVASEAAPTPPGPRRMAAPDSGPKNNELRSVARVALNKLDTEITAAKAKTKDGTTLAHLADLQSELKTILSEAKK
ncbi:zinc-dependent metalloprotease [Telmatocola sphagniphila]|uniref:Zinc-dependent metalloprotease n=1 Tax=Telmatocola sphagniphila TaxID=1123043 RepID=A0A8E6B5N5_9BACT|nr:zinc-dependent metalloprotease [Telmatocola sphagniphila]QVL31596.1 zinc-dependent metalloprotease [Telmatocola sphagniphila]